MLSSERLCDVASLGRHYDLNTFDSGEPHLDEWLIKKARPTNGEFNSRSYVWVNDAEILGYFCISPLVFSAADSTRQDPALLIGRLATCSDLRGTGEGRKLAAYALKIAAVSALLSGGMYLVVDVRHEKVERFWESLGFKAIEGDHSNELVRMALKMTVLHKSLKASKSLPESAIHVANLAPSH